MAKKRICDIIIETLVERGVTQCFAVTGGGAMFLDNALFKNNDMKKMFNHHEQACAMAAEGYARYSNKMALVCVTSGPGGTNTLTGVMGAWEDSIPMMVISGQVRYNISVPQSGLQLRYRGTQEYDIVDTVKPMTKYAKMIINPLDIKYEVNKAVDIAMSGRRGPVWLDIPLDIQSALVEESELKIYRPREESKAVDFQVIELLFKELSAAKRPVILLGRGVAASGSREVARKVIKILGVPCLTSSSTADLLYRGHQYYYGSSGTFGPRAGNFIIQNADMIVSIGCSLGFSSTGFAQEYFAPKAKIIAFDIDPDEMKKPGLKLHSSYVIDAYNLLNLLCNKNQKIDVDKNWLDYCHFVYNKFSPNEAASNKRDSDRVCSYVFWDKFYKHAKDDTIVVLGNNTAIIGALQNGIQKPMQRIIGNKNCGSMGYDIPAAIGAAIASNKHIILVTGDGSFMMNLQELQTIKHYNLRIKIIVFENNGYNAIRQTHNNFFDGELIGCTPETGISFPSFKDISKTFGFAYSKCERNENVDDSLDYIFNYDQNILLEVSELLDDPVIPKLMSRKLDNGTLLSPALHDMAPFLTNEEIKQLMISEIEDDKG